VAFNENLPVENARFPGDDDESTWHVATFRIDASANCADEAICCASFMLTSFDAKEPAWQLRGMATARPYRCCGLGRELLNWAQSKILQTSTVRFFWCNARLSAIPFYEKIGWRCVSEQFEDPVAGPSRKMVQRL
jgi:predicted GNAT family N-acyltransferase